MECKGKSINCVITKINHVIYLPAIQRKYVWDTDQITRLMDSIMLNYPIGTFLFWKVKKETVNEKKYSMYEFIKNYHERDTYKNPAAPQPFPPSDSSDSILAVLDGQQRLSSLYMALQGSISYKLPRKRWTSDDAFPTKELYFNLHSGKNNEDDDITYEFSFLTEEECQKGKGGKLWYKVKDILKYLTPDDVKKKELEIHDWNNDNLAQENILRLHKRFVVDPLINYFEISSESIDNVLDIFVRVNSGGVVLSKSDLLFSTIVSHWDDARDKVDDLLTCINKFGQGYKFSNDFIMRACLYLLNMPVTLRVENFKQQNVLKIKSNWSKIETAIKDTVKLLDEFGFNFENIISYFAILPIVYYKFNGGTFDSPSRDEIRKYLVVAQLKQIFGASNNSVLTNVRVALKEVTEGFTLRSLQNVRFAGDRNLIYTADDIDQLFDSLEKGAYTFMILSLLYPDLKYNQHEFHQDHLHPYSAFENKKLSSIKLPNGYPLGEAKITEWQHKRNTLANLQLLEGRENESKNDTTLENWLNKDENRKNVKYFPNVSSDINHFEEFLIARQELMSTRLKEILL